MGEGKSLSGPGGDSRYSIEHNEYGTRLGTIIDILHDRYEIGFLPGKPGKKLHHVSLALTKAAIDRQPELLLRYRTAYRNAAQSGDGDTARAAADWKLLDSRMLAAVRSPSNLDQIFFSASWKEDAHRNRAQFLAKIRPDRRVVLRLPSWRVRSSESAQWWGSGSGRSLKRISSRF
jgi:hypothetical protein